ncbi:hypothetical protein GWK47_015868 [Chionoecetes opilio]|uniref:Uncharacterized protein n=1 Tax=Chionoecetes opilio TaxID=41210 RepID=A0A8J4XTU0_CHIOP|nr:hypothetical protein GWK47_015868 [Chionoecetes opilio]
MGPGVYTPLGLRSSNPAPLLQSPREKRHDFPTDHALHCKAPVTFVTSSYRHLYQLRRGPHTAEVAQRLVNHPKARQRRIWVRPLRHSGARRPTSLAVRPPTLTPAAPLFPVVPCRGEVSGFLALPQWALDPHPPGRQATNKTFPAFSAAQATTKALPAFYAARQRRYSGPTGLPQHRRIQLPRPVSQVATFLTCTRARTTRRRLA